MPRTNPRKACFLRTNRQQIKGRTLLTLRHTVEVTRIDLRLVAVRIDHEERTTLPLLAIRTAREISVPFKLAKNFFKLFLAHRHGKVQRPAALMTA